MSQDAQESRPWYQLDDDGYPQSVVFAFVGAFGLALIVVGGLFA